MKTETSPKAEIEIKSVISPYLAKWPWFVITILFFAILAFLYIRYTVPEYVAEAKIQINSESSSASQMALFQDLEVFSPDMSNVLDEIEVIKSRSNFYQVIEDLRLNVSIYLQGSILDSEIYSNRPLNISFIEPDSSLNTSSTQFYITLPAIPNGPNFYFSEGNEDIKKTYSFGSKIETTIGDIVITPNIDYISKYPEKNLKIAVHNKDALVQNYQQKIIIYPSDQGSNIIVLALRDSKPKKAKDILNRLIHFYNYNDLESKRLIAEKTSQFINNRINDISVNLSSVDQTAEEFKSGRGLTDIESESNINLSVVASNRQEIQNIQTQLSIATAMREYVDDEVVYDVLPSNIGLSDPSIAGTTAKYNELVLERKRLLESSNESNPIIVNLDQQLNGLKRNLQSSLGSMANNLNLQLTSLSRQRAQINSRIYSAPSDERTLRDITRKQQTTESLYLYLLEKREESQIAYASAAPKSQIIENAYQKYPYPVTPEFLKAYLIALILGLILPFVTIYIRELLDTKIHNKMDLEQLSEDTPVIGELPKLSRSETKLIRFEDRTVLAEALRILRTNLDYLLQSKRTLHNKGNVIFVTSSVPGEGKTFISSNLAMVYASTKKKVLLVGADIRNPRIYSFFSGKNVDKLGRNIKNDVKGLTEFLTDPSLKVKDIISTMLAHTSEVDVIYSGKIPPNPAELLMSDRMEKLFEEVSEKYDYIVVDTAPTLVVTDTLLISKYAHQIIYVTKAGMTEKKVISYPVRLRREGKLRNLSFVVNNVGEANLGYGGNYGYGYGRSKKKRRWSFS